MTMSSPPTLGQRSRLFQELASCLSHTNVLCNSLCFRRRTSDFSLWHANAILSPSVSLSLRTDLYLQLTVFNKFAERYSWMLSHRFCCKAERLTGVSCCGLSVIEPNPALELTYLCSSECSGQRPTASKFVHGDKHSGTMCLTPGMMDVEEGMVGFEDSFRVRQVEPNRLNSRRVDRQRPAEYIQLQNMVVLEAQSWHPIRSRPTFSSTKPISSSPRTSAW